MGTLALDVTQAESETMGKVRSVNAGVLSSNKGVSLPMTDINLPALSVKDESDIPFAVDQDLDCIFASFIPTPRDVQHIRSVVGERGSHIKVISKIESYQGNQNFPDILNVTEGVMVAPWRFGP